MSKIARASGNANEFAILAQSDFEIRRLRVSGLAVRKSHFKCLYSLRSDMSMFSESSFFLNLLFFRAGRPPSPWELCGRGSAVRGASLTNQNAVP